MTYIAAAFFLLQRPHEYGDVLLHLIFPLRRYCVKSSHINVPIGLNSYHNAVVCCSSLRSSSLSNSFWVFQAVVTNTKSVWMCVCVRLPWFFFVEMRLWHEGAGRFGRRRRGLMSAGQWAQGSVASDRHHRPVLALLWRPHTQSPVSTSHPPYFLISSSPFVCLFVSRCGFFCTGKRLGTKFVAHLKNYLTNYCWCNTQLMPSSCAQREHYLVRCAGGPQFQFHTSQSLFTSSWACFFCFFLHGESTDLLDIYSASISNRCLLAER